MIEISLTTALAFYGFIVVAGAIGIWAWTEMSTHRAYHALENQYVWHCPICAYTYLDEHAGRYSECPRCHSLNAYADQDAKLIRVPSLDQEISAEAAAPRPAEQHGSSKKKRHGGKARGPRRRGR